MSTEVRDILERISKLPEPDRAELLQELFRRDEQEWIELSREARRLAGERGINDETISQAVESIRYSNGSEKQ